MLKNRKIIICLGNGKNQIPLLRILKKLKVNTLIIDRKKNFKLNKNFLFLKSSIYDFRNNLNVIKKMLKKYLIEDVVYRSSGPSILLYSFISEFKKINKVSKLLSKSIYSKTYLTNFLKKKNINQIPSKFLFNRKTINSYKSDRVIKPDAPIVGKKNIFIIKKNKNISLKKFLLAKNSSHNKKISISPFFSGDDISAIYFKNKLNHQIELVLLSQELNFFKNEKLFHLGSCTPPTVSINKKIHKKINQLPYKLKSFFKNYHGFFSVSFKLKKNKIFIYEINIGLLGDKFSEVLFPALYPKINIFKFEILNSLNQLNKKNYFKIKRKTFVGIINRKLIKNKKSFFKYYRFIKN